MRLKPLSFLVLGLATVGGATLAWTSLSPSSSPSTLSSPAAITPTAHRAATQEICSGARPASRQLYVDVTYETGDPSAALAALQQQMAAHDGGITYASSTTGEYATASMNGWLPAGTDTSWLSALDLGKVVSISNSDNMAGPEVAHACQRLDTLERAEQLVIDSLIAGADRDAAMVLLELGRYELDNQRALIQSMQFDGGRTQVNVYFNQPYEEPMFDH